MLYLFFILTFYIADFSIGQSCPSGSIQGIYPNTCYQLISTPKPWMTAEYDCIHRGGHLASIQDSISNVFLRGAGEDRFNKNFWLGGSTMINPGTWSWSDFGNFSYVNWAAGQPSTFYGTYCNYMVIKGGKWSTVDCSTSQPYVCEYLLKNTTSPSQNCTNACPTGWTGSQHTGKCYKYTEQYTNMNDGEEYCQTQYQAHLPSIHNALENAELEHYAASVLAPEGWPWLGLYCTDADNCTWTDGSPYNYNSTWVTEYGTNGPPSSKFPCVVLEAEKTLDIYGDWGSAICGFVFPIICQKSL